MRCLMRSSTRSESGRSKILFDICTRGAYNNSAFNPLHMNEGVDALLNSATRKEVGIWWQQPAPAKLRVTDCEIEQKALFCCPESSVNRAARGRGLVKAYTTERGEARKGRRAHSCVESRGKNGKAVFLIRHAIEQNTPFVQLRRAAERGQEGIFAPFGGVFHRLFHRLCALLRLRVAPRAKRAFNLLRSPRLGARGGGEWGHTNPHGEKAARRSRAKKASGAGRLTAGRSPA